MGRSHRKKQWERRICFIRGELRILWWRGGSQREGEVGDTGVLSLWLMVEAVVDGVIVAVAERE